MPTSSSGVPPAPPVIQPHQPVVALVFIPLAARACLSFFKYAFARDRKLVMICVKIYCSENAVDDYCTVLSVRN